MPLFFIIGFPGSGKSHLGEQMASVYNYTWKDLDMEIEKRYNMDICTLVGDYGETDFREKERDTLRHITPTKGENIIISTGGGTPCFFCNIEYMLKSGTVIRLQCSEQTLFERLSKNNNRPLVSSLPLSELKSYIHQTLQAREPFYAKAHYTFSETSTTEDIHSIIEK